MTIDRHNYESYFLLYVDNELSAADRMAVDEFVRQNPDLDKELRMLKQSVLQVDRVYFENKDSLIKDTGFEALMEKLLLYADEELQAMGTKEIEGLLLSNDALAKEWEILRQTKIQPDPSIVFENKAVLYRTSGGRIMRFRWWRAVAAAVLLGFGIWWGIAMYKNYMSKGEMGGTITRVKEIQPKNNWNNTSVQQIDRIIFGPVKQSSPEIVTHERSSMNPAEIVLHHKDQAIEKRIQQRTAPQKETIEVYNKNDIRKTIPGNLPDVLEKNNKNNPNKNSVPDLRSLVIEKNNTVNKNDAAVVNVEKQPGELIRIPENKTIEPVNSYAKNAVYNAAEEEKNDTRVLYMDEEKVKRTVFGGLFRKLKRVIERKTGVNTGNSIKVAGFEIAIK